jgi:hypothetical protein
MIIYGVWWMGDDGVSNIYAMVYTTFVHLRNSKHSEVNRLESTSITPKGCVLDLPSL